jgi:hypothetical protein
MHEFGLAAPVSIVPLTLPIIASKGVGMASHTYLSLSDDEVRALMAFLTTAPAGRGVQPTIGKHHISVALQQHRLAC